MFDHEDKDEATQTGQHVHNCDCDNEDCDCETDECDCGPNVITLDMEDGTQKDFTLLDTIDLNDKKYLALAEVDSVEYDILRMEVTGDTVELSVIEDDEEFNAVAAKFDELFSSEEIEEEEEN